MDFRVREYQQKIIDFIISTPRCGLFLDMGMGKTVCTLTAIEELIYDSFEIQKVLVIAPLNVAKVTWVDEVEKWNHLKHLTVSKIVGSETQRRKAIETEADVYVINRENVVWLVDNYSKKWCFDMIIVDESSSFKSSKSKRFRALRKVVDKTSRVVLLTGTPAPNSLLELWPQLYLLDKGERIGKTLGAYRDKYFAPGRRNGQIVYEWNPREGAEDEVYDKISDICVSLKSGIVPVNKSYEDVVVELSPEEKGVYQRLVKDMIIQLDGQTVVASNSAVLANKLLQLANGCVYDECGQVVNIHSRKIEALKRIVDKSKNMLVFYSFKHDLAKLKKSFPFAKTLDGEGAIREWNAGKIKMLLVHPASAGHGLNLQFGGSTIVWYGLTWSLEMYQQANARLHRPGQKNDVEIYHIITKGTIDEKVLRVLSQKEVNQKMLLDALNDQMGEEKKCLNT